ncbi:tRNA glutamyl-Q(34) synthetase GluQRS [Methyloparacoccus murrellii]
MPEGAHCGPPSPTSLYRGRFAPSPSGPLHLGSLLTALASYLDARAQGGEWRLRIDDLDPYRTRPGAVDRILASLEALGLHWDGAPLYQSRRLERYREALERLQAGGWLYACRCSRRELSGIYPGTCRQRPAAGGTGPQALRLMVPDASYAFEDHVQGRVRQSLAREVGDFVLFRRDGAFAYHLATVVDDAEQGVTTILRGQDLLAATPRQICLQQLLDLPTPDYVHTPLLVDAEGRKLSKRRLSPEAETRRPGRLLAHLLTWLRQPLPAGLLAAPPGEILAWAVANWRLERLRGIGPIVVDETALDP